MGSCSGQQTAEMQDEKISQILNNVKHKLIVMSGKGGVGKSTVATGLALSLSEKGYSVGLFDIDVHGPSVAGLLGLVGHRINMVGQQIKPYQVNENLKVITMQGFLEQPDEALIWRGPLKIGVIKQLLGDADWGNLDFLIIDSPPGTGDEPLTIAQTIADCQAVIVTTPQEIALADVRKSLYFCQQVGMQVMGVVENMSGFICPACGSVHNIFKTGGGEKMAEEWDISFLGRIPIDPAVVDAGDQGQLLMTGSSAASDSINSIVESILAKIANRQQKGDSIMKIGIPVAGGRLCNHFGHCEQFAIVTVENNVISKIEKQTPPPHEPGVIPSWLSAQGVSLVLAGGMGERAQAIFNQKGVEVICGVLPGTPEEIVQKFLSKTLQTTVNACTHDVEGHNCQGGN